MKVSIEKDELVIRIPANTNNPPASKSGKSRLIATTNGNHSTDVAVNGKNLVVSVNAYIPA